jgi:hypothetical protein
VEQRRPPYGIAIGLLIAGALPFLTRNDAGKFSFDFFQPPSMVANAKPDLARVVAYYPAAAGALTLVIGWVLPRSLCALGCIAIGAALPVILYLDGGIAMASWGFLPGIEPPWDWIILGGLALTYTATRALGLTRPFVPLAFLCAVGGAAVLTWLVYPREPVHADRWLGLVTEQKPETVPVLREIAIVRGFLRNADFPDSTNFVWYAWWNVYLVAMIAFPLMSLRTLLGKSEGRTYWASSAHGAMLLMLIALLLIPVIAAAFSVQLDPNAANAAADGIAEGLVRAANAVRLVFPPLLLPMLALVGVSELLTYVVPPDRLVQPQRS